MRLRTRRLLGETGKLGTMLDDASPASWNVDSSFVGIHLHTYPWGYIPRVAPDSGLEWLWDQASSIGERTAPVESAIPVHCAHLWAQSALCFSSQATENSRLTECNRSQDWKSAGISHVQGWTLTVGLGVQLYRDARACLHVNVFIKFTLKDSSCMYVLTCIYMSRRGLGLPLAASCRSLGRFANGSWSSTATL